MTTRTKKLHEKVVRELESQYRPVLDKSADGVFIYLDDEHKVCNRKLASMFGYTKSEWEARLPFLDNFIAEDDWETVATSYWKNIKLSRTAGTVIIKGVRKDGQVFKAHLTQFPISYKRRLFTIGFVRKMAS